MSRNFLFVALTSFLLMIAPPYESAQSSATPPPYNSATSIPGGNVRTRRAPRVRLEPCWHVAGVSQSALQQRRALQQQARAEIQSVCADSSLTAQRKRAEIQQIHQQTHQQVQALITPAQQEALRACNQSRGHHSGGGLHRGSSGVSPCGDLPQARGASRGQADETEEEPEN
jgi:hypothetical protein